MDTQVFLEIFNDKHCLDYKKLSYKYKSNFTEFINQMDQFPYKKTTLIDFKGNAIVYIKEKISFQQNALKVLLTPQKEKFSTKAAEEEIISTSLIESIKFNPHSVRSILKGNAPRDLEENRIAGLKDGFLFISDKNNKINEENIYKLYTKTVGSFLDGDDKLLPNNYYRNDAVFVVGDKLEHQGVNHKNISKHIVNLLDFVNAENDIDDLTKASIIHFYFAYIHPYFEGNGRMARFLHLWFLIQKGYESTLFVPFSSEIEKSKKDFYNAFNLIESNQTYSNKIDVTPFIIYFNDHVYKNIFQTIKSKEEICYEEGFRKGLFTEKETKLWKFVNEHYAGNEFSTKDLEKDFKSVAYATVRSFVIKFENHGLLEAVKYSGKTKYKVK